METLLILLKDGGCNRCIPEELLGVAQCLWNHARGIADKHLDGPRRWRLHHGLQRACTAWNELLEFVDQPMDLDNDVVAKLAGFSENSAPRCGARYLRMRLRICEGDLDGGKPRKRTRAKKKAAAGK